METNTANLFETMSNMQKQAAENMSNATEQMKKNMFNGQTVDTDFFKKWYDSQMSFFNQNATDSKVTANPMEFFNTWMNNQMSQSKSWFENNSNPMMKNMNMGDDAKKNYDQMMSMFNNWSTTMNSTYSEMLKNFNNKNTVDSFTGMFNNADMYMKSYEFFMPMFKSIQDKTFTPDMFKQMFNAPMFKEMMDKMFNMQPDSMKTMSTNFQGEMGKMMDSNKAMFEQMKNSMGSNMPNSNEMFSKMFSSYNEMYNNVNNAVAPLMKLMPANNDKKNIEMMNDMSNEFNQFNMKNSQMQYMMYATGLKAMEEFSEVIYSKIRNNEEVSNFTNLYTEWLSVNDKNFVALFETEEYSKMQAEVSSFGNKLKHNIDLQLEKSFAKLPLINRTEMNDLYKTIHELKKRINVLEKQIDSDSVVAETKPAKKTAKSA